MSMITITCPRCGITLEADEKYLGSKVACTECEHEFTLWTPEESLPSYPDMLEEFKPGVVAKAGLPLSFQSPLFTHEQLAITLSEEDSKRIFHFSYPLLRPCEEGVSVDGNRRYWTDSIDIWGEFYLMCKEWFDYNRKLLIHWLRQMEVDYSDLKDACRTLLRTEESATDEPNAALPDFDECIRMLTSVTINKVNQFKTGPSLNKPILCISIIYAMEKYLVTENAFARKVLAPIYNCLWDILSASDKHGNIQVPFVYMVNDGFWNVDDAGTGHLNTLLFKFLSLDENRIRATNTLLQTFFSEIKYDALDLWERLDKNVYLKQNCTEYVEHLEPQDTPVADSNQGKESSSGKLNFDTPIAYFNFWPSEVAALQNQKIKKRQGFAGTEFAKIPQHNGNRRKKVETMQALIEKLQEKLGKPDDSSDIQDASSENDGESSFSFDAPNLDLAHTKPYSLEICGEKIELRAWSDLIAAVASFIFRKDSEKIECLAMSKRHPFSTMRRRVCIAKSERLFTHGKKIADHLWIETNFPSQKCVLFSRELADYAELPQESIKVFFAPVGTLPPNINRLAAREVSTEKYINETIPEEIPAISADTFTKGLDWSSLTMGVTIPVKSHEAFLAHLQTNLQPGDSYPVLISVQGKEFRVAVNNISFADPNHNRCLMFLWSRKSPMALMLQATFPEAFAQLRDNHADKHGISDTLTVSCGDEMNHFIMEFSKAIVIPDAPRDEDNVPEPAIPAETISPEFQEFADKCGVLLDESFASGFRMNSPITIKRFRSFWEDKYSEECEWDDADIQKAMRLAGVEFDERIYAPRQLASPEVFDELKEYVEQLFAEGKPVIYYQALFDEFIRRGTDWKINSPKMLKSFLAANDCPHSLRRSCIAIDCDVTVSPISEIRDYLREQQEPVGYDKLQAALPHLPLDVIKHELTTNTEFVNAARGKYMHADIVDLSESDLEVIADMIRTEIHSKGYMTGTELWGKLEAEYPEYTDRYSHLPLVGFRDALKHKFFGQFNFQGNIISSVDEPIRMADIFAGFCRRRNTFTLADLDRLRADADTPGIYFEPVYENSVRISQDDFVSPESISFDIDAVDEAIGRFCNGDFIAIADITSFAAFPSMGVQWTSYLVEAFVTKYSRKFKLLHNQYNATVCAGAILRADAKLYDYSQVLAVVLAKANCELDSAAALDYLCNAGFLGRRRYTDIAIVLSEARQIRSRKR